MTFFSHRPQILNFPLFSLFRYIFPLLRENYYFPPISGRRGKFPRFDLFQQNFRFSSSKISDDLFLLFSHRPHIFQQKPLDFQQKPFENMYFPGKFEKPLKNPSFFKIPEKSLGLRGKPQNPRSGRKTPDLGRKP